MFLLRWSHTRGRPGRAPRACSPPAPVPAPALPTVSWGNHLQPEANSIKIELEARFRTGPPGDARLRPEWREVYEDFVWSLVNAREFVWLP